MTRIRTASRRQHRLVARAIDIVGTQQKLADAANSSQQTICRALNLQTPVSAELAAGIEIATKGEITRVMLRPDIFFPAATPSPATGPATASPAP